MDNLYDFNKKVGVLDFTVIEIYTHKDTILLNNYDFQVVYYRNFKISLTHPYPHVVVMPTNLPSL